MGLTNGSVSLCRYRVLGLKKTAKLADFNQNLKPFQARGIKLQGMAKEELVGWVRPIYLDDLELSDDDHWDMSDCRVDDGFLLRLRLERRKLPAQLLQLVVRGKIRRKEARRNSPLSRPERKQVFEDAKAELLEKTLPTIGYIDAYWSLGRGELLLFATSRKSRELFEDIFRKTFGQPLALSLVKIEPPLLGLPAGEWKANHQSDETSMLQRISLTIPTSFAEHSF